MNCQIQKQIFGLTGCSQTALDIHGTQDFLELTAHLKFYTIYVISAATRVLIVTLGFAMHLVSTPCILYLIFLSSAGWQKLQQKVLSFKIAYFWFLQRVHQRS